MRIKALLGNKDEQYNLGNQYCNGKGVSKDYAEAMKWYRKAADQGHPGACYCIGLMHEGG